MHGCSTAMLQQLAAHAYGHNITCMPRYIFIM